MNGIALVFYVLMGIILFLFLFIVYRKTLMAARLKKTKENREIIKQKIESFLTGSKKNFKEGLEKFANDELLKDKNYRSLVDGYLLDSLEQKKIKNRDKLISIAGRLDFATECLGQIRSNNPAVAAMGSRRAGLYRFKEAVDQMMSALDIMYSENQFEILMALARIGDADALQRAFEKIKSSVIINERAVIEILSSFPEGEEKIKLFRNMIHSDTDYLKVLFLKASDCEMVNNLIDDIKVVLQNGNKNIRAAAIKSLGALEKDAPADLLLHALEDIDWEVRALAARALGPVKNKKASMALYAALRDKQWWVRQNAANALTKQSNYEELFILAAESGDEYTRDSIIFALENGVNPLLLRSIKIMGT